MENLAIDIGLSSHDKSIMSPLDTNKNKETRLIEAILTKRYYYNLKNVLLLLSVLAADQNQVIGDVKNFFCHIKPKYSTIKTSI